MTGGICALVLFVLVLSGLLDGRGDQASARAARARAAGASAGPTYLASAVVPALSGPLLSPSRALGSGANRSCGPAPGSRAYVNPLAGARVTPERIDQGVDYAGSGTLAAIGPARITYVAADATGWPGAFIEYRLLAGPDAGCYVYYAEGVKPAPGLHTGQMVGPGQPIANIIQGWSTGIELGWGAGGHAMTYAAMTHQWSAHSDADSIASGAGKSFSALIVSLGGPSGKVEG